MIKKEEDLLDLQKASENTSDTKISYDQLTQTGLNVIDQINKLFPHWKRSSVIRKVKETNEGADFRFVATIDGEIIAHVKYEKRKGYHKHIVKVTSLIVSKKYRKQGIGKKLIKFSIKKLPKEVKIITLVVDDKNTVSINFCKKMGFKKYGLLKKASFIKGKYIDNYMMELPI